MEVIRGRQRVTLGCAVLDQVLEGGFPCGAITELVGESTAAKTQLALQLLVTVQLPGSLGGSNGSAIYIHTEGYFPGRRLRQLASAFQSSRGLGFDPCDNVFVEAVGTIQELIALFDRLEQLFEMQREMPVRLLVIDSIAALFRSEFENNRAEMVVRAATLFQVSAKLKRLAHRYDVAVVVTNQVMDCMDGSSGIQIGNLAELVSSRRRVAPALGLAWGHCINIRIFLSRSQEFLEATAKRPKLDHQDVAEVSKSTKRELHVLFAPHLPYRSCEFVVNQSGIHGVLDDDRENA
ncbi:DNA repair protein XRCC3 homolog [Selaginella moellendorffii]|uniref:DNA repair protein XRCC3 homolog n=1 Tax=Selaginella moellendorffii TaxID=88036 RepID=UPI000D1C8BCF|nr:DNA repair protein XRCC3 homolog [Selaginella moellendorffii]|eukprot:XP_024532105.1 DNA repair protein XRCC3 homolog [Selaginella moellendorffii]